MGYFTAFVIQMALFAMLAIRASQAHGLALTAVFTLVSLAQKCVFRRAFARCVDGWGAP